MRVLVVEDESMIAQGVIVGLKAAGISVDWVRDGLQAEAALRDGDYAVALLDLGLPGADGLNVLKFARREGVETPVLVVTARDSVDDATPTTAGPLAASDRARARAWRMPSSSSSTSIQPCQRPSAQKPANIIKPVK